MKKQIKRFLSVSLSAIMLFSALAVAPLTATAAESEMSSTGIVSDGFEYRELSDGTACITENRTGLTEVIIPSEIDGRKVTKIGACAFWLNSKIKSVTIPEGVTSIGDKAFYCCEKLESVIMPDSVTSIGKEVFKTCQQLK